MASFHIRAARPEDCSDLLRLIKVRAEGWGLARAQCELGISPSPRPFCLERESIRRRREACACASKGGGGTLLRRSCLGVERACALAWAEANDYITGKGILGPLSARVRKGVGLAHAHILASVDSFSGPF